MGARTGLLVLKNRHSVAAISSLLAQSRAHIESTLFIQPNYDQFTFDANHVSRGVLNIVSEIYAQSDVHCPGIDVRVLLPATMPPSDPELLLSDYQLSGSILLSGVNSGSNSTTTNTPDMNHVTRYRRSCLGGTFDRLHAGHKILLSEACLIATDRAVIGLAQGALLEQKLLRELILPFDRRLAQLNEFLISVQSHLKPDIVPIEEPFGPSITDGSLDVMILSDEVKGAIEKVNQLRQQAKLPPLSSHVINGGEMLSDDKASTFSPTDTVSSSAGRTALLGELVKPVTRAYDSTKPYVIGITGMLASGKSSVCKRLEAMGAFRLDADKLGHLAYVPATAEHDEGPAYRQVIAHFGDDIVNEDGFIDRKKLGTKVFADPNERKQLEQIVWPAIQSMVERDVKRAFESGKKVDEIYSI